MRKNRRRGTRPAVRLARGGLRGGAALAAAVAIGALGVQTLAGVVGHPYFSLRAIEVEGGRALDRQAVVAWAGLEEGESLWAIDATHSEKLLLRNPRVRSANVAREFPDRVRVAIEEREPIAVLLGKAGALFVDRDGQFFPPLGDETIERLPFITGIRLSDLVSRPGWAASRLRVAARVLALWRSHVPWPPVSEVRPEENGDVLAYPERTPMVIRFGAAVEDEEFSRLTAVFRLWQGREGDLAAIDVSVPGQVVVRVRTGDRAKKMERPSCRIAGCRLEI